MENELQKVGDVFVQSVTLFGYRAPLVYWAALAAGTGMVVVSLLLMAEGNRVRRSV